MTAAITEVHPYFTWKARSIFEFAGGDPDDSRALAQWAQDARSRTDVQGVIVDVTGEIVAETIHVPATASSPGVTYVRPDDAERLGIFGNEVGLAMAQIRHALQRHVIHVTRSEVCFGAGPDRVGAK